MKIIDSSIYCAPYEIDLLYLKLLHEADYVDEFCIAENAYDYHGVRKGHTLRNLLSTDNRFTLYRDKISVFELDRQYSNPEEASNLDPQSYAIAEWELRDAATSYLVNKYDDNDRVFSMDIDEFFDFTDPVRRTRIMEELNTDDPLQFDRVRYIYDYDNFAQRSTFDMICPSFKIKHLKNGTAKLRDKKWVGRQVGNLDNPVCFEYCSVFTYEGYISKFNSSLHTQWQLRELNEALTWNTWEQRGRLPDPNCRWHWFQTIELNEKNSPKYIRENLNSLKTHLLNPDYVNNRIAKFGFNPTFKNNGEENFKC